MLKQRDQEEQHIYDYLSGVPITSNTKFFNLNNNETNLNMYKDLIYFFDYATASYGWPMYLMNTSKSSHSNRFVSCLELLSSLKNCAIGSTSSSSSNINNGTCINKNNLNIDPEIINNDNCCFCYYDALIKQLPDQNNNENNNNSNNKEHIKLIHADFSSDISKPCYFVAVDYFKQKIVITIRGTESLKDSITNMQWNPIKIPDIETNLNWNAHEVKLFYLIFSFKLKRNNF